MKVSYNWLQSFFKKKPRTRNFVSVRGRLPGPEKLAEILTMRSFEVEKVEKKGDDWVLDIDVLPNRAHDCLSHLGMAREIAAILKLKVKSEKLKIKVKNLKLNNKKILEVKIKDYNLCPRYTALAIENIKVGPSPKWMQERLMACGLRSINNIVDIANYVMLEYGQPLHAFDMDKISPVIASEAKQSRGKQTATGLPRGFAPRNDIKEIIVRRAKKGEKITTLDGEKYDLDENVLVIADRPAFASVFAKAMADKKATAGKEEPLAIAGIKGGKKAEITEKTKTIILESANFNPLIVRRGSRKLNLRTDASQRFEAGLDPNLTSEAIERVAGLIQEIANGEIVSGLIDIYPEKIRPKKIKLEIEKVKRLFGVEIPIKEIKSILERLGFKFQVSGSKFQVIVPTWRPDINLPEDLIEEIGRLHGYINIPSILPNVSMVMSSFNQELVYENKIKDILAGAGLNEVINFSFTDKGLNKEYLIELENPVSQEEKYLRDTLIFGLLKNIKENLKYFNKLKIFEIGKTYLKNPKPKTAYSAEAAASPVLRSNSATEDGAAKAGQNSNLKNYLEKKVIAGALSLGQKLNKPGQLFYEAKGIIELLLNKLEIVEPEYDDSSMEEYGLIFEPQKRAEIKIGEEIIGWFGEINQRILPDLGIKTPVAAFEIDFETLIKIIPKEKIYQPLSKYPEIRRDLTVLTPSSAKIGEVSKIIKNNSQWLKNIEPFNIYQEETSQGKKNLSFHLSFQSNQKTLNDKEVNQIQEKIIQALEDKRWEVRK